MIHLFYCVNSMTDSEVRSLQDQFGGDGFSILSLPCSGRMTIPYLLKAFETGADGVVICSCPPTRCRNLEGNLRASKRAGTVDELMQEVGLGASRVLMIAKEQGDLAKAVDSIESLRARLPATDAPEVVEPLRTALTGIRTTSPGGERRGNAA
jgi:F420-non-reducing hydrogenase iron-sulfur subunit